MKNETDLIDATAENPAVQPAAKTRVAKTEKTADFASITTGAAAVDYAASYLKSIEKYYPHLIGDIEKSGYINGGKFFRIYLRHSDKSGKSPKYIFIRNIPVPTKLAGTAPAKKSGRDILTVLPAGFKSLTNLHHVVFIITITVRGTDYRSLHINTNH
jgi:hypothetical protein